MTIRNVFHVILVGVVYACIFNCVLSYAYNAILCAYKCSETKWAYHCAHHSTGKQCYEAGCPLDGTQNFDTMDECEQFKDKKETKSLECSYKCDQGNEMTICLETSQVCSHGFWEYYVSSRNIRSVNVYATESDIPINSWCRLVHDKWHKNSSSCMNQHNGTNVSDKYMKAINRDIHPFSDKTRNSLHSDQLDTIDTGIGVTRFDELLPLMGLIIVIVIVCFLCAIRGMCKDKNTKYKHNDTKARKYNNAKKQKYKNNAGLPRECLRKPKSNNSDRKPRSNNSDQKPKSNNSNFAKIAILIAKKKINEVHISKWMEDDVAIWIINVFQQCGIPDEQIGSFVKDLQETHLTGRTLESLNNKIELETFRRLYFSKENQKNFTVWKEFELALRQLIEDMYPTKMDRAPDGYYTNHTTNGENYKNQYLVNMNPSLGDVDACTISSGTTQDRSPYLVESLLGSRDQILLCKQHSTYTSTVHIKHIPHHV